MLIMSGDQIYADHVAGPMLDAIEQLVKLLGLPDEEFDQAPIKNTQELYQSPDCFMAGITFFPTMLTMEAYSPSSSRIVAHPF